MKFYFLRSKPILFLIVTFFIFTALTGCIPNYKYDGSKLNIVSTIFPGYDFARAVTGDKANLEMLIRPGLDVHSFDPSPLDIIKIKKCDVFIYIGGESDVWVKNILSSIDTSNKKVIRLMDYISPIKEEFKEGTHSSRDTQPEYDEHIWTSPKNAIIMINAIRDAICEIDSANSDVYVKNANNYTQQISDVDAQIAEIINKSKIKTLVVADRFPFRYFAAEFGLNYVAAFPGCSTEGDISAAVLANLVNTVKSEKIPCIYHLELSQQNISQAVKEQTGCETALLHSCHNPSKEDFENGSTYLSLMTKNIESLKKGFI